ncbi:DNA polymerase III subunit delta [Lactobacillus sp. DCY120]|uniref:DNA polymerase III subunit delta n=1 Tax=Bombilactobacillus apium TaxID=2675299 RepID=A0A850R8I6_9LACO|nr:DNA polymerase III subunit delta [Bombilactobacillus apium]NVY95716.1 DNA polymerase III subunit delta [Bombilactobacillus apium]
MNIKELKQALQTEVKPLYLVQGTEQRLLQDIRQLFFQLLTPEEQEMNFAEFDLNQVDIEEAVGEANSLPFFGRYRLIFVNNPGFLTGLRNSSSSEQNLTVFEQYLQTPQETTILVLFAPYEKLDRRKKITKLVQKQSCVVDATKLQLSEMKQLLKQELQQNGQVITSAALEQLVLRTNGDYSLATNEVHKLQTYSQKKPITLEMVQNLVPQTLDDNVFDLLDAILQGNLAQAENYYQQLLILKNDVLGLTALAQSQIRLLLQIKILTQRGMSPGKLASYLQVHPYRVKLALQRSHHYQVQQLKKALLSLIQIDYRMKTGQGQKERLFELFMINFITNKKTA